MRLNILIHAQGHSKSGRKRRRYAKYAHEHRSSAASGSDWNAQGGACCDDPDSAAVTIVRRFDSPVSVVPIDGRQMEQVFLNLALNAVQAMHRKGTVTIATREVPKGVAVSVGDTGPGIPVDALPRIFKPFFTTRAQGTGLGLAIVDRIVRGHGGTVRVDSPPGAGAVFTVTLPRGA